MVGDAGADQPDQGRGIILAHRPVAQGARIAQLRGIGVEMLAERAQAGRCAVKAQMRLEMPDDQFRQRRAAGAGRRRPSLQPRRDRGQRPGTAARAAPDHHPRSTRGRQRRPRRGGVDDVASAEGGRRGRAGAGGLAAVTGRRLDGHGCLYAPTLLADVDPDAHPDELLGGLR